LIIGPLLLDSLRVLRKSDKMPELTTLTEEEPTLRERLLLIRGNMVICETLLSMHETNDSKIDENLQKVYVATVTARKDMDELIFQRDKLGI